MTERHTDIFKSDASLETNASCIGPIYIYRSLSSLSALKPLLLLLCSSDSGWRSVFVIGLTILRNTYLSVLETVNKAFQGISFVIRRTQVGGGAKVKVFSENETPLGR